MLYTITHEDGTTATLDGSGKTEKVESLSPGTATIEFGERQKLQAQLAEQREKLQASLNQILAKTQAAAKKEKAYFDSKPRIIRGFLYNGACLWSTAKGLGDGQRDRSSL